MATLFISYASADRPFVLRLTRSLNELGHCVWVDVQEIRVGELIPRQVAQAAEHAEYLVVVLSRQSAASSWSEQEWYAKYWQEVTTGQTIVLPALLEECDIPFFLRPKCFADFRRDYATGLAQLATILQSQALVPALSSGTPVCYPQDTMKPPIHLTQVQVELSIPYVGRISGVWKPDQREQDAAWEMYVELVTRITVAELAPGEGSLRESLSSLYSLFTTTRQILRSYGPTVARPKAGGELSFGYLAISVLNYVLRPVLSKWHPLLSDYEHQKGRGVSPFAA